MTEALPLLGLTGFAAHRRIVIAASRRLAALAGKDLRRRPPTPERMACRAFTAESFAAAAVERDSVVCLPTAGLPELHRLIDQIRPWYPEDTIGGLLLIVAAAEARLAERLH
jgi:hypothetical protein